jgi:hypothetical protein
MDADLENQNIELNPQNNSTLPTVNDMISPNNSPMAPEPSQSEKDNVFSQPEEGQNENDNRETENSSESEPKNKTESSSSYIDKLLCIFSFIRPYFKVTFNDIKTRVKMSFIPISNNFFVIADKTPDLYGPFWIYTTLIYVIAAGGALSYYFTNSANNYFQMFVPVAGSILYSFGFGFPFALWICMKIFKIDMRYISLVCLYGYSLCCLIPVLILCSTGFGWIQWIFLTYGIANSTAFVLINLWNLLSSLDNNRNKYTFLGIFICGQIILFMILKLYFFGSFKSNNAPENNSIPNKTP